MPVSESALRDELVLQGLLCGRGDVDRDRVDMLEIIKQQGHRVLGTRRTFSCIRAKGP